MADKLETREQYNVVKQQNNRKEFDSTEYETDN